MVERAAYVKFYGRVQGVYFRAHTQREARRLGLTGWVRNEPDGTVEAFFEGDEGRIKEIISYCRHFIPMAEVRLFHVEWRKPTGRHHEFEIRR